MERAGRHSDWAGMSRKPSVILIEGALTYRLVSGDHDAARATRAIAERVLEAALD